MSPHLGKTALSAAILAEIGALTGAFVAWLFLMSWVLITHGTVPRIQLLATVFVAGVIGSPVGAVALPLVGLTVLRTPPQRRTAGLQFMGMALGGLGARLSVHAPGLHPLPMVVPALIAGGILAGTFAARIGVRKLEVVRTPELP